MHYFTHLLAIIHSQPAIIHRHLQLIHCHVIQDIINPCNVSFITPIVFTRTLPNSLIQYFFIFKCISVVILRRMSTLLDQCIYAKLSMAAIGNSGIASSFPLLLSSNSPNLLLPDRLILLPYSS